MPVRAFNLYYARDESARAQVLATRLRATDVRERIGIPRGRVFVRTDGTGELPDVMWDCPFPDAGAHAADMQARAASVEFEACRALMRTLTRRFERVIYDEVQRFAVCEAAAGDRVTQLWLMAGAPVVIDTLHVLSPTAILRRADDNARVPEWIVDLLPDGVDDRAIDAWIAEHAHLQATSVTWQRVG